MLKGDDVPEFANTGDREAWVNDQLDEYEVPECTVSLVEPDEAVLRGVLPIICGWIVDAMMPVDPKAAKTGAKSSAGAVGGGVGGGQSSAKNSAAGDLPPSFDPSTVGEALRSHPLARHVICAALMFFLREGQVAFAERVLSMVEAELGCGREGDTEETLAVRFSTVLFDPAFSETAQFGEDEMVEDGDVGDAGDDMGGDQASSAYEQDEQQQQQQQQHPGMTMMSDD